MDDFEEFKEGDSVLQHLIAGATAGTIEHCGIYPVDTIKVMINTVLVIDENKDEYASYLI
jgi:hypothetical protein